MNPSTLLLDAGAVRSVIDRVGRDVFMDALIEQLTSTIRTYDVDAAQVPPRSGVHYRVPQWGLLEWMPAHFGDEGTTVKLVGYHPANPALHGVPSVLSTICSFDAESGHLLGIVDGTLLTAMRTGAASAVASHVLALPDSRTLGVVGCGAQAVTQIHALSRLFPIEQIYAYDVRHDVAATLGDRVAFLQASVQLIQPESLADMLARCDIICTCTSAAPGEGPVIPDFAEQRHVHVNAVGSDFRGKYELPLTLLRRCLVCPDFREQAIEEGDCQQLRPDEIGPDLRAIVRNAITYSSARSRPTVFDSTGWALEDHVAARLTFAYARELGLGREVVLECVPPDPTDPYSVLSSREAAIVTALRPAGMT